MITLVTLLLAALTAYINHHDYKTTRMILENGGRELNPVMAWLLKKIGFKAIIAVKGFYIGALIGVAIFDPSWWVVGIGVGVALFTAYAVQNNIRELGKMGLPYQNVFISK